LSAGLTEADAVAFAACVERGGVAVFPADTVYGLACDPENAAAVARLYELKGRPADKPAAVMWFDRDAALAALPDLPPRARAAVVRTLGVRVPHVPTLTSVPLAVLQSSANHSGGPDARVLDEVPEAIRTGADLLLDAGPLPGTPSTVIDLRTYGDTGDWTVVREGAMTDADVARALGIVGHP
jgi:L-threonylcarbamoyladenylate synthase